MRKAAKNYANGGAFQGRGDGPLYSEGHGAEGKSSNSEEGEDGRIDAAP